MKLSKNVLKQIKEKIEKLVKKGESEERALALICDKNNLPIDEVKDQIDLAHLYVDKSYKDIKYGEGSYVTLKKNTEKPYEVININNKDTIILRDLDNNSEIKVSEDEIIPMVTETKMSTNLNEAQYSVSINNLETTDAETLSQMLSLAGQAESGIEEELPTVEPVAEPIPGTDLPPMEEPEITEFEPQIPSTMDGPGFEAAEVDSIEEPYGEESVVSAEEELPPEEDVSVDTEAVEEPVMDECGTPDAPIGESVEEEEIEEGTWGAAAGSAIGAAHGHPVAGAVVGSIIGDIMAEVGEKIAKRIPKETVLDLRNISDDEKEMYVDALTSSALKTIKDNKEIEEGCSGKKEEVKPELDDDEKLLQEEDPEQVEEALFTEAEKELTEEEMEKEIAEALRIAGVQLNEVSDEKAEDGKVDLPTVAVAPNADPTEKEQDGFKPGENQRPDWEEHKIEDIAGAECFQQGRADERPAPGSIYVGEMVSKDRIKAICETAAKMYAKKDKSEWLALDRRYVEKLIKEGVGYSNASKMLLAAKAGK